MKQLTEYTTKNLYSLFKPEEICFIIAKEDGLDYVDGLSYSTDDLDDALDEAKENDYKIFVYAKKLAIECLDTDLLYNDDIKEDAIEEFSTLLKTWFAKYFDNTYWIPDRLLGTLRTEEN